MFVRACELIFNAVNDPAPAVDGLQFNHSWARRRSTGPEEELRALIGANRLAEMDEFGRVQQAHVVSACRQCRSLSEFGRRLFSGFRRGRALGAGNEMNAA